MLFESYWNICRLFDQWEEDEEPLPEDEQPEYMRKPPTVDFSKLDTSNPEAILQATKKGQTLMMFVTVANKPSRARAEELTKIWQTGLWSNHIQAERSVFLSQIALLILGTSMPILQNL